MAKQVQLRRGTTAELSSVTGAEGEVIVDTTKDTITLHDGYTAGGIPMLREDVGNLAAQSVGIDKISISGASPKQALVINEAGTDLEYGDVENHTGYTAFLEYIDSAARFVGLYGATGGQGTDRALLPFNHVVDPFDILVNEGSNQFQVRQTGVYFFVGAVTGHNDAHHTVPYLYDNTNTRFARRPNATWTGPDTWMAPLVGYDSNQNPTQAEIYEPYWLETGVNYTIRWSNENNSSSLGTSTSYLFGNFTIGGVNKRNRLMAAQLIRVVGY